MAPLDTRRFTGPESSVDYRVYCREKVQQFNPNKRDGRVRDETRPVFMRMGVISKAKGSAYVERGNTKVMVGVYGPREVAKRSDFTMKGQITCELKFAPFACKTRRGHQADKEEVELGVVLRECLESTVRMSLYVKSCIDVFVSVIEDDGGVLATAITAAGLALSDAQISLYDNIVGVSVRLSKGEVVLDPSTEEEFSPEEEGCGEGSMTIGYLNTMDQVACLVSQGQFEESEFSNALAESIKEAGAVLRDVQTCQLDFLSQKTKKET